MRRHWSTAAWLMVLLGCDTTLHHGLDEPAANELQAALARHGISADKVAERGRSARFALAVQKSDALEATRILSELGLPRQKGEGFGEVFSKDSLVPSAAGERALFLQALSGELRRTLESVDGVLSARVHVVLPNVPKFGPPQGAAKAAAYLRVRPDVTDQVNAQREELKGLIAGSVEGLTIDNVFLVVGEVLPGPVLEKRQTRRVGPPLWMGLLLAGTGLLGTAALAWAKLYRGTRTAPDVPSSARARS